MKKEIYRGPDTGRFVYGEFKRFMGNLEDAEPVISMFDMGNGLFQIWFLKDVAVKYRVKGGGIDSRAIINLFGSSDEKISKVEKIILGENQ